MKRMVLAFAFMALLLGTGVRAHTVLPEPVATVAATPVLHKKIDMETATTAGTIITIVVLLLGVVCGGLITVKRFSHKSKSAKRLGRADL
jgi:hypothetical protein